MATTWPELHSGTNFNYVWEVATLAWVKEVQASGGGGVGTSVDGTHAEGAANNGTNMFTLPGLAAEVAPVLTEGTKVSLSMTLAGLLRTQTVMQDGNGNGLVTAIIDPTSGLRGLVVRNIPSGTQAVSAASLPLPTGAATQATLIDVNNSIGEVTNNIVTQVGELRAFTGGSATALPTLVGYIGGEITDNLGNGHIIGVKNSDPVGTEWALTTRNIPSGIQPISATALPLPTLAATSTLQTSGNASLATIATDVAPLITAQGAISTSVAGPMVQGVVSDTSESYIDSTVRPLSLTAEGRLRVETVPADLDQVWQSTFGNPWIVDNPMEVGAVAYV